MAQEELIFGEDYYFNEDGLMVFTAAYLLKRGYCCQSGCRHCPYGFKAGEASKTETEPSEKERSASSDSRNPASKGRS